MKQSLVSIIIPTYNQANYLPECINSVLDQSYSQWECLLVDDGSTDNTKEIAELFCSKDSRIRYIHQLNQGVSYARNNGIKNCLGAYILPLDGDDKIGKNYLLEAVPVLDNNANVKLVYCQAELFGDAHGLWPLPKYSVTNILQDNIIFCTSLFRKKDFFQTIGYNPEFIYCWEDWDFWLSLLEKGGEVVQLDAIHFYYRIRNNSRNVSPDTSKKEQMLQLLYNRHKTLFDTNKINPLKEFRARQRKQKLRQIGSRIKNAILNNGIPAINPLIKRK